MLRLLRRLRSEGLDVAENQLVGLLFVGHRVRCPMVKSAVGVEVHRQAAQLLFAVAAQKVIDVVPLILMKLIPNERHAEQKLHLRVGHSFFQLQHHLAGHEIALMHVCAVGLQEVRDVVARVLPHVGHRAAAGKSGDGRQSGCRQKDVSGEHKAYKMIALVLVCRAQPCPRIIKAK